MPSRLRFNNAHNAKRFNLHKGGLIVVAAGLAMAAAVDGMAQEGQQQQPQSPWTKLCDKTKVAAEGQTGGEAQASKDVNLCLTLQERLDNNNGQLVASVAIRQQEGEDGEHLMVIVPLGVDLRPALQAKIDGGKPVKLDYLRCDPVGCTGEAKATTDMVKAMKAGQQIVVETKGPRGRPMSFALPLAGFAAAYDGQPSDAKQYQDARQHLVSLIRARRAAEIEKAMQAIDNPQQPLQQQPLQQQPLQQQPLQQQQPQQQSLQPPPRRQQPQQ